MQSFIFDFLHRSLKNFHRSLEFDLGCFINDSEKSFKLYLKKSVCYCKKSILY